ncbi:hypothetical protein ABMA27_005275 [Loxostege sticticalis]|uniref:Gag protein n=1 Tax=Loxostege sticticalis TaxID=481309 RepID=A0ABR3HIK7_LOXSC
MPKRSAQEKLDHYEKRSGNIPSETTTDTSLDPEILSALGASTADTPDFGQEVHDSLASLWTPLLKKGLPKDQKENLMKDKEYLIPSNCKLLQAPKLNAEISAAVSDVVRGRDKKFLGFQQQLGTALKYLSDGCRILTDLHYSLTKDRIKLIIPSLEKNFLHVIQDSERDDTLFGNSLSEKIKASKAIERQGSQIRKTVPAQKSATVQSSVHRPAPQGNWSGPPRYPSNRGGGGEGVRVTEARDQQGRRGGPTLHRIRLKRRATISPDPVHRHSNAGTRWQNSFLL